MIDQFLNWFRIQYYKYKGCFFHGENIKIGKCCNLYKCSIASKVLIGFGTEIQNDCFIGWGTRIQSHSFICAGTWIGQNCFIGHGVLTSNDRYPKPNNPDWKLERIVIEDDVSVGSGAVLLPGIRLGKGCVIGAGSVVTKSVPAGETWVGNPARKLEKRELYPDNIEDADFDKAKEIFNREKDGNLKTQTYHS